MNNLPDIIMTIYRTILDHLTHIYKSYRLVRVGYLNFRLFLNILGCIIITPITNLITLVQTLWASRALSLKNRKDYAGFTILAAGTSPFYYRYSLELSRFGRKSSSPHLGLGNYPLNNFFHFVESLHMFRYANNLLILFSLFGWWISYSIWAWKMNPLWVMMIMTLVLLSNTLKGIFAKMNYNAVGWLFFPLAFYGISTGNWLLSGIAWFGVSFGSFTVLFIGGIFTLTAAFTNHSLLPLLYYLPACLKLIPNFIPLVFNKGFTNSLNELAKLIGVKKGKTVRYKRSSVKELFSFERIYLPLVFIGFIFACYFTTNKVNILLVITFLIFLLNYTITRFADDQTIWMLILSSSTTAMLQLTPLHHPFLLVLSFWILISPLPHMVGLINKRFLKFFITSGALAPVNIKSITEKFDSFLEPVQSNKRIYMAFENPQSEYTNIFDGLRFHIEFPLFTATRRNIHLFPDWIAVMQTNFVGAPDCWGREPNDVERNMSTWNADYAMIYQFDNNELDKKWFESGFQTISYCNWKPGELKGSENIWYFDQDVNWWLVQKSLA